MKTNPQLADSPGHDKHGWQIVRDSHTVAIIDAKGREHATLTTTPENGLFNEADDVTQLSFKLFITSQPTSATDIDALLANAFVCFDPPSNSIGDVWLTQGDHTSDDSMRRRITVLEPLIMEAPSYFTSYRIKAGHLPAGMTIGCSVELG